jgi:hypothetical protein
LNKSLQNKIICTYSRIKITIHIYLYIYTKYNSFFPELLHITKGFIFQNKNKYLHFFFFFASRIMHHKSKISALHLHVQSSNTTSRPKVKALEKFVPRKYPYDKIHNPINDCINITLDYGCLKYIRTNFINHNVMAKFFTLISTVVLYVRVSINVFFKVTKCC